MAKKRTSKTTADRASQRTLAAGNAPTGALSFGLQKNKENPTTLSAIFKLCRDLHESSTFLSSYLPLRTAFYNYGLSFTIGPNGKGDAKALDAWEKKEFTTEAEYKDSTGKTTKIELNSTYGEMARAFIRDCWNEFGLIDNCIGYWDDDGSVPTTLDPNKCRFEDTLGLPVLYYTHGLSETQIAMLPSERQNRYRQNTEILMNPDEGDHFKVLKRGLAGTGLNKPRLFSLFTTLGEIASKEYGFHALAFLMRSPTRHHKLGHEITQGAHAGKGTWFWNSRRGAAVLKQFEGRQGPHDFTSNFDHEITFILPDVKLFDETAWKGTNRRLMDWGGPIAQMMLADKIIEGGLGFLRAQVTADRQMLADFLRPILLNGFDAPEGLDLRVTWSDLIFNDPKQAAELLKFATQQGLSSVTTSRHIVGLNSEQEDALKVREADDPDSAKKHRPAWDMSHAIAPQSGETAATLKSAGGEGGKGPDSGKKNGRPVGGGSTTE
jgi:hypothetical protein